MKTLLCSSILLFLFSCNMHTDENISNSSQTISNTDELINSVKNEKGKFTVDNSTAGFLHLMENTVINFRDMAKKRNPPVNIYNEFSVLLDRNIEHVRENCRMKGEGHDRLVSILEKISQYNKEIEGNDLAKTRLAFGQILVLINEMNNTFDYRN